MSDGRTITVRLLGPDYGVPILTLHGNPGSRLGPHVSEQTLDDLGVRLIAPDRPGYGQSDRNEGRNIADTAHDMAQVMDALDIEEFGVIARSGGTPHALGCAALLGERVFGTMLFASLAPKTAPLEWTEGMTDDNKAKHAAAQEDPEQLARTMRRHASSIKRNSGHIIRMLWPDLQSGDMVALIGEWHEERTSADLERSQEEGLRQKGVGWVDDTLALHAEWGFDVQSIGSPVTLWHGQQDPFASPIHSRWLANEIPDATLIEDPNASHMSSYLYTPVGLRLLRNLYLGSEGLESLRDKILEKEQQALEEFNVTKEQSREPEYVSDETFEGYIFSDAYMRRRMADSVVSMAIPGIVRQVLRETAIRRRS